jgi:hypothetical protein
MDLHPQIKLKIQLKDVPPQPRQDNPSGVSFKLENLYRLRAKNVTNNSDASASPKPSYTSGT